METFILIWKHGNSLGNKNIILETYKLSLKHENDQVKNYVSKVLTFFLVYNEVSKFIVMFPSWYWYFNVNFWFELTWLSNDVGILLMFPSFVSKLTNTFYCTLFRIDKMLFWTFWFWYSGQHWRDVVLTPDELYLDLLSYSGDLIKLSSFTEYNDKLKASAAFVNRVLPPELSLNLSQKCLFLVEGKNRSHYWLISDFIPKKTKNTKLRKFFT